ncbi:hypothetical protein BJ508DRAFT_336866, partial [Ascobolus immersus RN42]
IFHLPTAVQHVLRGHITGLSAPAVSSIYNGTFKALDLCKLRPDLLRHAYGLDDEQKYLTYTDGVLSTTATSPASSIKEKLVPYVSYAAFTRYWTIYTYIMTSLFGALHPNLVYGLNLHLYNVVDKQQKHQWSAILNYHFSLHQRLLDDGPTALFSPERWAVIDPIMLGEYLGGDTYRQSPNGAGPSSTTPKTTKPAGLSALPPRPPPTAEEKALQYCHFWNDPKRTCAGQDICGRRHECENCGSKDHKTPRCTLPFKPRVARLLQACAA